MRTANTLPALVHTHTHRTARKTVAKTDVYNQSYRSMNFLLSFVEKPAKVFRHFSLYFRETFIKVRWISMCFLLGLCATVCLEIFSVWVQMFGGCERNVCFVCIWLMCFSRIAIVSPLKYKSLFLLCMRYVSVAFPFIVHFVCLSHARYITWLLVIKKNFVFISMFVLVAHFPIAFV